MKANIIKKKYLRKSFALMVLVTCVLFSKAQDGCVNHWETIVYADDAWRYVIDSNFQDHDWKLINYNDSLWSEGKGGIGYGDNDDLTIVPSCKMLYLRKEFVAHDTAVICKALLSIDYDDGFVAYLNGAEIARSGVTDVFPDANSRVTLHEANMYTGGHPENFVIYKDSLTKYLIEGANLLSFQILNASNTSSDLSSIIYFSVALSSSDQTYGPLADEIVLPVSLTDAFDMPLVCIETNGNTINRESRITADMKIIHHENGILNHLQDSGNIYTGKVGIKLRGSSSSGFPQKPYSFETRDSIGENLNVSLFNMPSENDWILLSNFYDRSFVRNFLSHEIFRGMGHYSPRGQFCEVLLNGEYRGVYFLIEKIKVDKGRVDISKLKADENSGDDVTGGYIIKNDNYYSNGSDSWSCLFPEIEEIDWDAVNARFVYEYPDWDTITVQQKAYIQSFIETSKDVLYSDEFTNPISGYYAYFDVPSFVDYFIISEVSRNGDAYKKSRFFHKDKDSKGGLLKAGPPWDFDWAWKNLFFQSNDGSGWVHYYEAYGYGDVQPVRYINQMLQDKYFANEIYNRYFSLRQTVLHYDTLLSRIDSIADLLTNAQDRHFQQWDILNDNNGDPDSYVPDSYEDEITHLKRWIQDRLTWLDNHMIMFKNEGYNSISGSESLFYRVFPNPAVNQVYIESNKPIDKLEVMTTAGNIQISHNSKGEYSCTLDVQSLTSGLYLVRITVQNRLYIKKLIIM